MSFAQRRSSDDFLLCGLDLMRYLGTPGIGRGSTHTYPEYAMEEDPPVILGQRRSVELRALVR